MAARNEEKRREILTVAYRRFTESDYDRVSLSDIAKGAGINKSLLQHYYPQKLDIVKVMLNDLLRSSFAYMDSRAYGKDEIFQKISDFNMLFFKGVSCDRMLNRFLLTSVRSPEILDTWIDIIADWLKDYCSEETFSYLLLKRALVFSMGGSMHLFQHKDELGISYPFICRTHIWAILNLLSVQEQTIAEICQETDRRIAEMDPGCFLQYCSAHIPWLEVSE